MLFCLKEVSLIDAMPRDGDLVLREEADDDMTVYILHVAPGPDRISFETRKEALTAATEMARRFGVRVWLANGPFDFTLVDDPERTR